MNDDGAQLRRDLNHALRYGHYTISPPLPRRVRLRLWLTGRINHLGIWLVERGHPTAAERLWRACGMW